MKLQIKTRLVISRFFSVLFFLIFLVSFVFCGVLEALMEAGLRNVSSVMDVKHA